MYSLTISKFRLSAEIMLEGYLEQGEMAPEGPYGDAHGYYSEVDNFRCLP